MKGTSPSMTSVELIDHIQLLTNRACTKLLNFVTRCDDILTFQRAEIHLLYSMQDARDPTHTKYVCSCGYSTSWKLNEQWKEEPCTHISGSQ